MKKYVFGSVALGLFLGMSAIVYLLNKPESWKVREKELYTQFYDQYKKEEFATCATRNCIEIADHYKCPMNKNRTAEEDFFDCMDANSKMEDATVLALAMCIGAVNK